MSESLLSRISPNNLKWTGRIFTILFTLEFFTKVMTHGLFFTSKPYLKSGWNVMDSFVLAFAWVDETGLLNGSSLAKVRIHLPDFEFPSPWLLFALLKCGDFFILQGHLL